MADRVWEEYWKNYGQQLREWAEQAKNQRAEGLHMPGPMHQNVSSAKLDKVKTSSPTWRDQEPML